MIDGERLIVDRCFARQDGSWAVLCVLSNKVAATVAVPEQLPEGAAISAKRVGTHWQFLGRYSNTPASSEP